MPVGSELPGKEIDFGPEVKRILGRLSEIDRELASLKRSVRSKRLAWLRKSVRLKAEKIAQLSEERGSLVSELALLPQVRVFRQVLSDYADRSGRNEGGSSSSPVG